MSTIDINELPNELLDDIFRFLYEMHWEGEFGPWEILYGEHWLGDPFDPSMFPFAQAKVCRRWCALLAYYPKYWTRIPVVVDRATTPPHHVANYLAWSQDLPIQVFVKSHPDVHYMHGLDEKSYVDTILPYISHHLYHIETIEFSLHHSCIPNLPRWLIGQANFLESIQLSYEGCPLVTLCAPHDHDSDPQVDGDPEIFRFSAPNLTRLSIDWRTFVQACRTNMSWLANAPMLRNFHLTVSGPCYPTDDLSVGDTIRVLSQHRCGLETLSIEGVPFTDDDEPLEPLDTCISDSLRLEGLKGTKAAQFVYAGGAFYSYLTISDCSLLGFDVFTALTLTLENYDEDCDLTGIFDSVRTSGVNLCNCPAFNDAFLEFMAQGGSSEEDFPARGLCWLSLKQCTNFSVEWLYHMILSRRTAMEASLLWDGTLEGLALEDLEDLSAIVNLHVTDGPPLSEEYRSKFERLVPYKFYWTEI